MNFKKYSGKFYCFSPPVMLLTFLFEFGAAFYVLWRYKVDTLTRLVILILLTLGTFQLSEYMICGGLGLHGETWARLGYVSITALPALGIHLVVALANKKAPRLLLFAYTSMIAFALYFALLPNAININECRPNYAVFNMEYVNIMLYSAYYMGWLLTGVLLTIHWAKDHPAASALKYLCIGYLTFMVPVVVVNLLDPATMAGIPSIMCGFAVLLAAILIAFVLPKSHAEIRKGTIKKR